MSDSWTFYFTRSADGPASFYVNLGLASEAPIDGLFQGATVTVRMIHPREDGLSRGDEAKTFWQIEDALNAEVTIGTPAGISAGRITAGGRWELFYFVPSADGWTSRIAAVMTGFPEYQWQTDIREDRAWEAYTSLLPNEEQRESIENRKVCEQLESRGDALNQPREIDHWINFPLAEQRENFAMRAAVMGFLTRGLLEADTENDQCGIQIYRVDLPSFQNIDQVTLPLYRLARECGGEYTGWETQVLKPD
jgi:regulator of RNase E activity RraB